MPCGDVPWEGSSRRSVSLEAPCHVEFYVRSTGTRRSRAVGERQESLSLRVSPPARPVIVSCPPIVCVGCLCWGWVRPPAVLTRPRASAQGLRPLAFPPLLLLVVTTIRLVIYTFAKASPYS